MRPFRNFGGNEFARSNQYLACFQVASSCILPSIQTGAGAVGMASTIFRAKATSAGIWRKHGLAKAIWVVCSDQAPRQP